MRHTCCSETSRLESWGCPLHSGGITRPVAHCTIGKLSRAEFESLGKTHWAVKRNDGDHKRGVSYGTSSVRSLGNYRDLADQKMEWRPEGNRERVESAIGWCGRLGTYLGGGETQVIMSFTNPHYFFQITAIVPTITATPAPMPSPSSAVLAAC